MTGARHGQTPFFSRAGGKTRVGPGRACVVQGARGGEGIKESEERGCDVSIDLAGKVMMGGRAKAKQRRGGKEGRATPHGFCGLGHCRARSRKERGCSALHCCPVHGKGQTGKVNVVVDSSKVFGESNLCCCGTACFCFHIEPAFEKSNRYSTDVSKQSARSVKSIHFTTHLDICLASKGCGALAARLRASKLMGSAVMGCFVCPTQLPPLLSFLPHTITARVETWKMPILPASCTFVPSPAFTALAPPLHLASPMVFSPHIPV